MPPGECFSVQEPSVGLAPPASVQRERDGQTERDVETKPYQQPNRIKDNHCRGESRPHFVNASGSGLSVTLGGQESGKHGVR